MYNKDFSFKFNEKYFLGNFKANLNGETSKYQQRKAERLILYFKLDPAIDGPKPVGPGPGGPWNLGQTSEMSIEFKIKI